MARLAPLVDASSAWSTEGARLAGRDGNRSQAAAPSVVDGIVSRPELFERLGSTVRVAEVSAPAGSGKTVLARSWLNESGLADSAAWLSVGREEHDPRRFWLSLLDALRSTKAGSTRIRSLRGAPDLNPWEIVEWLLEDLGSLEGPLWLVIDDVHELRTSDTLRQLELLLMRAPAELRFVLITRHDLRLGLHRLRLEGGLTEIRADALRFSLEEAGALLAAAGVELSDRALALLHERTEGWAAGIRLAALSLADHPDPERFATEFSGTERTVAEYLLTEVLDRQPEEVRRLLLVTSVLDRVNGQLADLLTGGSGGEGVLRHLELANAFVVSLDASRTWFRYHQLFADLLQTELRGNDPDAEVELHRKAAGWFDEHHSVAEAVRHAQAAGDWSAASRMLSDGWLGLQLSGNGKVAHQLLAAFPAWVVSENAELTAMAAADNFARGALDEATRLLALATARSASVPADRQDHFLVAVAILRLELARERGDIETVIEQARRLLTGAEATVGGQLRVREEYRAMVLISLGIAELWTLRLADAEAHLEQGIALARSIGQPYLEILGLGHWAFTASTWSYDDAYERSMQAVELARENGWGGEPTVTMAYITLVTTINSQGRLEDAAKWLERADRSVSTELQGVTGMLFHFVHGVYEHAIGHLENAASAYAQGSRVAGQVIPGHPIAVMMQSYHLQALARMGETDEVERAIAAMDERNRGAREGRIILAALRLAQNDPGGAVAVLAPLRASGVGAHPLWPVQVSLLEAAAHDQLGDADAAADALERALSLAEDTGTLMPFLLQPEPELLMRHQRRGTNHPAVLTQILERLGAIRTAPSRVGHARLPEPLTERELRVLRYLPTNLSRPEIAEELYVGVATIKTHIQHIYAKLGAHSRRAAVERARDLGLLASSMPARESGTS